MAFNLDNDEPTDWNGIVRVTVGYTLTGVVVWHFLSHNEPYDTKDLFRAIFGTMGLQLAINKNPLAALDGFVGLVRALRGGKNSKGDTSVENEVINEKPVPKKKKVIHKKTVTGKPR
jgi:hypothetical protein